MPALILMYHDFADDVRSTPPEHRPYVLSRRAFRGQLESDVQSGLDVLSVELWCSRPKPARGLVLTFDDGHVSNYDAAFPILAEFGLKATFFVTAGRIGKGGTMNWTQIRELHSAGMEIGSHTLTHRPPSTLNDQELRYELSQSRRILEDGLGAPVTSVSSPTGFFNARMRSLARETGYRALCHGRVGLVPDGGDPFSLNRVAIKRALGDREFQALLRFDRMTLGRMRSQQWMRELARRTMSVESYVRLRRLLMRTTSA